ncbi:MAG: spermidine synthase [Hyphomicrobiales bacterium]|nr:MAG: spermidine synthase [Hyphomicrobiales bacterium]
MRFLLIFFFMSGFPALIYQILWQRALFGIFGTNIEAVTLVVSSFMLGLGIGSLAGGRLSLQSKISPLFLFGIFELSIGIFGFFSLAIIDYVGQITIGLGPVSTFLVSFVTVLIPTFLMGATLPLLLMHLVRNGQQVGQSVSLLYSVNTWGSAVACFVGAFVLFGTFGMQGSIYIAVTMNILVGFGALVLVIGKKQNSLILEDEQVSPSQADLEHSEKPQTLLNPTVTIFLTGIAGFISLSYEILWTRAFFLFYGGTAYALPIVLGLFLAGIALGASISRSHIKSFRNKVSQWQYLPFALLFIIANIAGFLTIPALINLGPLSLGVSAIMLIIAAASFGALLPLISDLSIRAGRSSGKRVSYLYVANIIGSTSGTIITGLWLLDNFQLHRVAAILFTLGSAVTIIFLFYQPNKMLRTVSFVAFAIVLLPMFDVISPKLHHLVYEKLQFGATNTSSSKFANISETKSGVVAITGNKTVFGTGVYDGTVHVNLMEDRNGLYRATAITAIHPGPKKILVIGLSMGAWTQILSNIKTVEHVTAVEINRGYLELIEKYPSVQSVLTNPKIDIVIDDGRRWLRRNPDEKFDVIVANTTFFWRSGASNLLSVEFLKQVKSHLNPGGIYFYNTTSSDSVQKTGASVFPHVARFEHFLFASNEPIKFDKDRWRSALGNITVDGDKLLDFDIPAERLRAEAIISLVDRVGPLNKKDELDPAIEFRDSILNRTKKLDVITEDNMGDEWPKLFKRYYSNMLIAVT